MHRTYKTPISNNEKHVTTTGKDGTYTIDNLATEAPLRTPYLDMPYLIHISVSEIKYGALETYVFKHSQLGGVASVELILF